MKKVTLAVILLAAISLAIWTRFSEITTGDARQPILEAPESAKADRADNNDEAPSPFETVAETASARAPENHAAGLREATPATLTQSNFRELTLANSLEEAIWLRDHGYPNKEQLREYSVMPLGELEGRARAGDPVAKVMAGIKLVLGYENPDGIKLMQEAAIEGSAYALSSLSSVYAARGPQHDAVLAEAYRHLALARGDYVMVELPRPGALNRMDLARAEAEFLRLSRKYAQARADRKLPPLQTEIRPGFENYLNRLRKLSASPQEPMNP